MIRINFKIANYLNELPGVVFFNHSAEPATQNRLTNYILKIWLFTAIVGAATFFNRSTYEMNQFQPTIASATLLKANEGDCIVSRGKLSHVKPSDLYQFAQILQQLHLQQNCEIFFTNISGLFEHQFVRAVVKVVKNELKKPSIPLAAMSMGRGFSQQCDQDCRELVAFVAVKRIPVGWEVQEVSYHVKSDLISHPHIRTDFGFNRDASQWRGRPQYELAQVQGLKEHTEKGGAELNRDCFAEFLKLYAQEGKTILLPDKFMNPCAYVSKLNDDNKQVPKESIVLLNQLPIETAAKHLGISPTSLKHICRDYGIARWQCRAVRPLTKSIKLKYHGIIDDTNCVRLNNNQNINDIPINFVL